MTRKAILVLGMHRAGTSVTTRIVSALGAALPKTLLPAAADNPQGFWESERVIEVNERILRALDLAWDTPLDLLPAIAADGDRDAREAEVARVVEAEFGTACPIAIKDPRINLLLPYWLPALRGAGYDVSPVICLRGPAAVAASLARRNGFPAEKSQLLWLWSMLTAEAATRGQPRIVLAYEDLIRDPVAETSRLFAALRDMRAIEGSGDADDGTVARAAETVEPALDREGTADLADTAFASLAQEVDGALRRLANAEPGVETPDRHAVLDRAGTTLTRLTAGISPIIAADQRDKLALRANATRQAEARDAALAALQEKFDTLQAERGAVIFGIGQMEREVATVADGLAKMSGALDRLVGAQGTHLDRLDHAFTARDRRLDAVTQTVDRMDIAMAAHATDLDARLRDLAADSRFAPGRDPNAALAARGSPPAALTDRFKHGLRFARSAIRSGAVDALVSPSMARACRRIRWMGLVDLGWYGAQTGRRWTSKSAAILHHLREGHRVGADLHPFVDTAWLRRQLAASPGDGVPLVRFLETGLEDDLTPHPLIWPGWYLRENADAVGGGWHPLRHFLAVGAAAQRAPSPMFDPAWYLAHHPDVTAGPGGALHHYLTRGWREGRRPAALFDPDYYLTHNPDVAAAACDPYTHYLCHGGFEGRDPNPWFASAWYLDRYADAAESGANPLVHYITVGWRAGRDPSPAFNTAAYREANAGELPDGTNPLAHFLAAAEAEGRPPRH